MAHGGCSQERNVSKGVCVAIGAESMEKPVVNQDPLTGLLNRVALEAQLRELDTQEEKDLTLLSVQISHFGSINSSLGGEVADKIITLTAKRLQKTFPNALAIARTHGDYFCLLFDKLDSVDSTVDRLEDFTRRPFVVRGEVIVLRKV